MSRGLTRAVLRSCGKIPDFREWVIIVRKSFSMQSKLSLKNLVGIGSKAQVDGLSFETVFLSRSMDGGEKEFIAQDREGYGIEGHSFGRVRTMFDLMFMILL